MSDMLEWNGEAVRKWLETRFAASRRDQDRADRGGRADEADYDKAAAEEWVCSALKLGDAANDQAQFAAALKALLARDEYHRVGVHDERRFEREVRSCLRKIAKMTKTNTGFGNLLHHQ
jgi:hypothetical protein